MPQLISANAHSDERAAAACEALDAEAYAFGDDIAFASPTPRLETVAHEVGHTLDSTPGVHLQPGPGHPKEDSPAEKRADAFAGKVASSTAGMGDVKLAETRLHGEDADDTPPNLSWLADELEEIIVRLESKVLNDAGRLHDEYELRGHIGTMAFYEYAGSLGPREKALLDRGRKLLDSLAGPRTPAATAATQSKADRLEAVSPLVQRTVADLDEGGDARRIVDPMLKRAEALEPWALELQSVRHTGQSPGEFGYGNYLNLCVLRLRTSAPDTAAALGEQLGPMGIAVGPTSGAYQSLAHRDPNEPLPPGSEHIGTDARWVDNFVMQQYEPTYRRGEPGALSDFLQLTYRDGVTIDIQIGLISDNRDGSGAQAVANAKEGAGGRLFPLRMSRDTTPRIWAAKQGAVKRMTELDDDYERWLGIGMVMAFPPVGMIVPEPRPAAPLRLPQTSGEPATAPGDAAASRPSRPATSELAPASARHEAPATENPATAPQNNVARGSSRHAPVQQPGRPTASDGETSNGHQSGASPAGDMLPSPISYSVRVQALESAGVSGDLSKVLRDAEAGSPGAIGEIEAMERWNREGKTVEALPEHQNVAAPSGKPRKNPDFRVGGELTELKTRDKPLTEAYIKQEIKSANAQIKDSGLDVNKPRVGGGTGPQGRTEIQLKGEAALEAIRDPQGTLALVENAVRGQVPAKPVDQRGARGGICGWTALGRVGATARQPNRKDNAVRHPNVGSSTMGGNEPNRFASHAAQQEKISRSHDGRP